MAQSPSRRIFPYIALASLVLPVMGFASAATQASNQEAVSSAQYSIRQLSDAEVADLAKQGVLRQSLPGYAIQSQPSIGFANPAFQRTWERTDKLVADGTVKRSWFWGPTPGSALQEDYAEGQGGKRVVQYFDKSRMEINDPNADPNSQFFVTNGLLTVELISGKMQTGNGTYVDRYSAAIPLASDNDDNNAPTYASFLGVSNTPLGDRPATSAIGQPAILTINKAGNVGEDPTKGSYPGTRIAHFEEATKHNIPEAMWQFLNESGPVYNSATGLTQTARLSDPWFYATGLPISEAYWANVKIAGQSQDVLIQAFERRVVTYAPNGVPGFKVQMGNIGQHYYDWRYNDAGMPPAVPTPVVPPTVPAGAPTATAVPPTAVPDPGADCSGIPAQQNMVVRPDCGPGGTLFSFVGSGFDANELVGVYVTLPDQAVFGAPFQAQPDSQGRVGVTFQSLSDFPTGVWGMTMEGINTHRKAIGYFKITSRAPTPTRPAGGGPPPCEATQNNRNGEAQPSSVTDGDRINFTARGFRASETISFWFTYPDGDVIGTQAGVEGLVNPDGSLGPLPLDIDEFFTDWPGTWGLTFQGDQSGNVAVIYFCVYE